MEGLIVGQIVHFVDLSGEIWPGIVVKINDQEKGIASMQVFHEGFTSFSNNVPHQEEVAGQKMIPGTWHFIAVAEEEQVDEQPKIVPPAQQPVAPEPGPDITASQTKEAAHE